MRQSIITVLTIVLVLAVASAAFAFDGTRADAMESITSAMESPEIGAWVVERFGSEEDFMKALDRADDGKVAQAAQVMSDLQADGAASAKDTFTLDAPIWAWAAIFILIIILL